MPVPPDPDAPDSPNAPWVASAASEPVGPVDPVGPEASRRHVTRTKAQAFGVISLKGFVHPLILKSLYQKM